MKKNIVGAFVTLFLLIAVYGALWLYSSFLDKAMPTVEEGTLDLSAWSFEEDGIIQLDGEWELYPGQLLSQQDLHSLSGQGELVPKMIQVPGSWSSLMETKGMATYRLRIQFGDERAVFGLKTG